MLLDLAGPPASVRRQAAAKGQAIPDPKGGGGRFPIRNEADLRKAVRAFGRARPEDKAKVRAHIIRRARALGRADLIPDSWKGSK